eukprot:GEZU01026131.1.p1 GENE.GEZU01026131.1~~GEZU01026131.1.p1  ORF type:complete len:259 (-),score=27.69 GEZU01026131.1:16-792(-)
MMNRNHHSSHLVILILLLLVPPLVLLISAATAQQQQTIFTHGVASGEVSQTACILWTRAATNDTNVNLVLQVTTDPTFAVAPIQATHLRINASDDYTVKVAVSGLSPAVLYHYRFFVYNDSLGVATDISPAGQFKTAYDVNASSDVRFVYSGDADGARKPDGTPYYNSFETLQQAAKENPDFFIFDGVSTKRRTDRLLCALSLPYATSIIRTPFTVIRRSTSDTTTTRTSPPKIIGAPTRRIASTRTCGSCSKRPAPM